MGKLEEFLEKCKWRHSVAIAVWCVPAFILTVMMSMFGAMGANSTTHYNIETEWQACFFAPNDAIVPLTSEDTEVKMGSFIHSAIVVGCTVLLMTAAGLAVVYRSYNKPRHLIASGYFSLWCTFIALSFYTSAPPVPIAADTNSTALLFMYWLRESPFTDLNDGNNHCQKAYDILVAYFFLCMVMVACLGVGTRQAFRAGFIKFKQDKVLAERSTQSANRPELARPIAIITILTCLCTMGAFIGRIMTSFNTLNCLRDYDVNLDDITTGDGNILYYPDIYFPFIPATITLSSVLWGAMLYLVVCSYVNNIVRHYRIVAFLSAIYVMTGYPSITYLLQLFYDMNLDDLDTCNEYWSLPENAFLYGYPNYGQSVTYCTGTRMSTYLATAAFALMHVQFVLCYLATFVYNQDRLAAELERDRDWMSTDSKKFDSELGSSIPGDNGKVSSFNIGQSDSFCNSSDVGYQPPSASGKSASEVNAPLHVGLLVGHSSDQEHVL